MPLVIEMGEFKNKVPTEIRKEQYQQEREKRDLQVLTLFVILGVMTLLALIALQGLLPVSLFHWGDFKAGF
ncbi:MAG: hypothetical protein AB7O96_13540 [Pseudobdellovibrionaceae bacterium]